MDNTTLMEQLTARKVPFCTGLTLDWLVGGKFIIESSTIRKSSRRFGSPDNVTADITVTVENSVIVWYMRYTFDGYEFNVASGDNTAIVPFHFQVVEFITELLIRKTVLRAV